MNREQLYFAPNSVSATGFEILRENHENYEYPQRGWSWFDSEEEARIFFGLPIVEMPINNIV